MNKRNNIKTHKTRVSSLLIASIFIISGCQQTTDIENTDTKKPFYIAVQTAGSFPTIANIQKPGRVISSQEITITSQAIGRIQNILIQEGSTVRVGQPIIQLRDSVANYASQVDRTKNALDRAILQYEQTVVSLDKSIKDAINALEQSKNAFSVTQQTAEQNLKKAFQDLQNTDYTTGNTQARLTLEKAVTDINNQLNTIKNQLPTEQNNAIKLGEDVAHFVDTILGVTTPYQLKNTSYEIYLGATNPTAITKAKDLLLEVYELIEELRNIDTTQASTETIRETIRFLNTYYDVQKVLLQTMNDIFKASVVTSVLPQSMLDGFTTTNNNLQSRVIGAIAGITNYSNQVQSILGGVYFSTGDDQQKIRTVAEQQIAILLTNTTIARNNAQIGYDTTRINMKNALFNAELAVKNAQSNYDTLLRNKNIQLSILENAITDARIAYQDAQRQFSRLTSSAPIAGKIIDIMVDEGQEVSIGTPLFSIISYNNQLVEVFVHVDELPFIYAGKNIVAYDNSTNYPGKIINISSVADRNMQYKVTIGLDKPVSRIGDIVTVDIPIDISRKLLPINSITSLGNNQGFIYILKNNTPIEYDVTLGKTRGNMIEITSILPGGLEIITSDMSNYDQQMFELFLVQTGVNGILPLLIPLDSGVSDMSGTSGTDTINSINSTEPDILDLPLSERDGSESRESIQQSGSETGTEKLSESEEDHKKLEEDAERILRELLAE